jgi:hypothetical protein
MRMSVLNAIGVSTLISGTRPTQATAAATSPSSVQTKFFTSSEH